MKQSFFLLCAIWAYVMVLSFFGVFVAQTYSSAWDAVGVMALEPKFSDLRPWLQGLDCLRAGIDIYQQNPCDPLQRTFNYSPILLEIAPLHIGVKDIPYFAAGIIIITFFALCCLVQKLAYKPLLLFILAVVSPSFMLGVERMNLDLFCFSMCVFAGFFWSRSPLLTLTSLWAAVTVKLYPFFSAALLFSDRKRKREYIALFLVCCAGFIFWMRDLIPIIQQNTPQSFFLSHGYQAIFIGIQNHYQLMGQLDASTLSILDIAAKGALFLAGLIGILWGEVSYRKNQVIAMGDGSAASWYLIGGGIFLGTFVLGTHWDYRLCFLLLLLPQAFMWQSQKTSKGILLILLILLILYLSPFTRMLHGAEEALLWLLWVVLLQHFWGLFRKELASITPS